MKLYRKINKDVELAFAKFAKNSSPEPQKEIDWRLFYDFIISAFKVAETERPSVSQLSDLLRETGFDSPGRLAVLYAHALYYLAIYNEHPIYENGFNP